MPKERREFDGRRISEPGSNEVWLVFHGRRHRIASPRVYDALFDEVDGIEYVGDLDDVLAGNELNEGTCLVRGDGELSIYLLTGVPYSRWPLDDVKRHFIPTYEDMLEFRFDEAKVRNLPILVLQAISIGEELTAATVRS